MPVVTLKLITNEQKGVALTHEVDGATVGRDKDSGQDWQHYNADKLAKSFAYAVQQRISCKAPNLTADHWRIRSTLKNQRMRQIGP